MTSWVLWTTEQEDFLRSNVGTMTHKEIGDIIGRSEKAVRYKCFKLGLKKQKHNDWDGLSGKYRREYYDWRNMMERCYNPECDDYQNYGGRGIYVIDEWHDFTVYLKWDLANRINGYTRNRVDNNGPYSPQNCVYSNKRDQNNNTRLSISIDVRKRCFHATRHNESYSALWQNEFSNTYTKKQIEGCCDRFVPVIKRRVDSNKLNVIFDAYENGEVNKNKLADEVNIKPKLVEACSQMITLFGLENARQIAYLSQLILILKNECKDTILDAEELIEELNTKIDILTGIPPEEIAERHVNDVIRQLDTMFQEEFNETFTVFFPANLTLDIVNDKPAEFSESIGV